MTTQLDFIHRFEPAQQHGLPTLLLLHGTGGDEHDLIDLGKLLLPGAALLSPRGKIDEGGGVNRFFRRLAPGKFDMEDLRYRTHELADFVPTAAEAYAFDPAQVVAVGYSNGANIAASILLLRPQTFKMAVLFHPMVPLAPDELPDLNGVQVFIGAGRRDPITPPDQAERLALMLQGASAQVELHWQPGGHQLTMDAVQAAQAWLARR
ncbi:MAG: alpha/beta hydrolase [Chloroflexaceae bacterium]|nr:alpha/beta hydrolase [Chloroflexaceae bacterium]